MSEPRLVVEGLCIDGPDGRLVAGTSFVARDGQVLGVTGPSGAGKSLAMRAAMGVVDVRPGIVAGQLRYEGTGTADLLSGRLGHPDGMARLEAATARFRGGWITLAPQAAASALNPARTVGAHLHRALARAEPSVRGSVAGWLERVGLHASVVGLLPGALSGGMAQRVGIALALAPAPRVLIADEPEAGLDPVLRGQILELLADVATASGCATVLVSHDHRAVASIAHHTVSVEAP